MPESDLGEPYTLDLGKKQIVPRLFIKAGGGLSVLFGLSATASRLTDYIPPNFQIPFIVAAAISATGAVAGSAANFFYYDESQNIILSKDVFVLHYKDNHGNHRVANLNPYRTAVSTAGSCGKHVILLEDKTFLEEGGRQYTLGTDLTREEAEEYAEQIRTELQRIKPEIEAFPSAE